MAVVIAPWLNEKPSDFVDAARAGAAISVQTRGQDLENSARMAAIAQQGQDAAMQAQEAHERIEVEREVQKNRIALQTQHAANIYQQQQQRQRAIDGGMDPIQAWLQYPGTNSGSVSAGFANAYERQNRASLPLQMIVDPNDPATNLGVVDGTGQFHPTPKRAAIAPKADPKEEFAMKLAGDKLKAADAGLAKLPPIDAPFVLDQKRALLKSKLEAQSALNSLGVPVGGRPAAAPAGQVAPGSNVQPALPQRGQVVNGHTFLGGDPADENSWQEVGTGGSSFIGTPGDDNQAALPGSQESEGDDDQD